MNTWQGIQLDCEASVSPALALLSIILRVHFEMKPLWLQSFMPVDSIVPIMRCMDIAGLSFGRVNHPRFR